MGIGQAGWLHPDGTGGAAGDRITKSLSIELGTVTDKDEGSLIFKGAEKALPSFTSETTQQTQNTAPNFASDTPDSTIGGNVTTTTYNPPASDATPDSTLQYGTSTTTYSEPASDATPTSTIGTSDYPVPASDAEPDYKIGATQGTMTAPDFTASPESTVGSSTWNVVTSLALGSGDLIDQVSYNSTSVRISYLDALGLSNHQSAFAAISVGKWIVLRKDASNYVSGVVSAVSTNAKHASFQGMFTVTGTVSVDDDVSFQVYAATSTNITMDPGTWTKTQSIINANGLFNFANDFSNVIFFNSDDDGTDYESELEGIAVGEWVYVRKDASNYAYGRVTSVVTTNPAYTTINATGLFTTVGTISNDDTVEIWVYAATALTFTASTWTRVTSTQVDAGEWNDNTDSTASAVNVDHIDAAGNDVRAQIEALTNAGNWIYFKKDDDNYIHGLLRENSALTPPTYADFICDAGWVTVGSISGTDSIYIEVYAATATQSTQNQNSTWTYDASATAAEAGEIFVENSTSIQINRNDSQGNDQGTAISAIAAGKWIYLRKDDDNYWRGRVQSIIVTFAGTTNESRLVTLHQDYETVGTISDTDTLFIEVYTGTESESTSFVNSLWGLAANADNAASWLYSEANNRLFFNDTDQMGRNVQSLVHAIAADKWVLAAVDGSNYVHGMVTSISDDGVYSTINLEALTVVGTISNDDNVTLQIFTAGTTTVDVTTITETAAATVEGSHTHTAFVSADFQYAGVFDIARYRGPYTGAPNNTEYPAVTAPNFRGYYFGPQSDHDNPQWGDVLWDTGSDGFRGVIAHPTINPGWGPDAIVSSAMFVPYGSGVSVWLGMLTEAEATAYFDTNPYDDTKTYYYYNEDVNELRRITAYTASSMNMTVAMIQGDTQNYITSIDPVGTDEDNILHLGGIRIQNTDDLDLKIIGSLVANIVSRLGDTTQSQSIEALNIQYKVGTGSWTGLISSAASIPKNSYQTEAISVPLNANLEINDLTAIDVQFRISTGSGVLYAEDIEFELNYEVEGAQRTISEDVDISLGIEPDGTIDYQGITEKEDEVGSITLTPGNPPTLSAQSDPLLTPEALMISSGDISGTWNNLVFPAQDDNFVAGDIWIGDTFGNKLGPSVLIIHKTDANGVDRTSQITGLEGNSINVVIDDNNFIMGTISVADGSSNRGVLVSGINPDVFRVYFETPSFSLGDVNLSPATVTISGQSGLFSSDEDTYIRRFGKVRLAEKVINYDKVFTGLNVTVAANEADEQTGTFRLQYKRNDGNWTTVRAWADETFTPSTQKSLTVASTDTVGLIHEDCIEYRLLLETEVTVTEIAASLTWSFTSTYWLEIDREIVTELGNVATEKTLWTGSIDANQSADTYLILGENFTDWRILAFETEYASNLSHQDFCAISAWENTNDSFKITNVDARNITVRRKSNTSFQVTYAVNLTLVRIIGVL